MIETGVSSPSVRKTRTGTDRPAGRWVVEGALVALLAAALTAALNSAMIRSLSTAVPHDTGDPLYFAWQLSWIGHALATHPAGLLRPPVYSGRAPGNLAFTDMVFGYAPLQWLLGSGHAGAIRLVNVAILVSIGMSFVGAHALARVLGANVAGGLLAGAGFAFAPWRLEQIVHINVMSTGVAVLALAALCRGHGWSLRAGWRPERVHAGWILTGWLLAALQLTYGFAIGLMFAWLLLVVVGGWLLGWVVSLRRSRGSAPRLAGRALRSAVLAEAAGGLVFAGFAALLVRPYLWVIDNFPEARRGQAWLYLSPPWRGLLTAPQTSVWWGTRQAGWRSTLIWVPEMVLLPGFTLITLALIGLLLSSWSVRRRGGLLAAVAVLTVLSLGIRAPGQGRYTFLPLYHHLPGWNDLRTPGRLMIWVTLGLCLLAAGAVTELWGLAFSRLGQLSWSGRPDLRRRGPVVVVSVITAATLVLPAVVVTLEGRGNVVMQPVSYPALDLTKLPQPILVLPTDIATDYWVMSWQTDGWPVLANGSSSFDPRWQTDLRRQEQSFPSAQSVATLKARGIATVVLIPDRLPGTPWSGAASRPIDGLGITRRDVDGVLVYDTR